MTHETERTIMDGAGDLWFVEDAGCGCEGGHVQRYRHEMGYELLVATPRRLPDLSDAALVAALEETRRRLPRIGLQEAA